MGHRVFNEVSDSHRQVESPSVPHLLNLRCCGVSITHLDLSYSYLKRIPHDICSIKNLKTLDLSHNEITCISLEETLPSVQIVSLDFNNLVLDQTTLKCIGIAFPSLNKLSVAYQGKRNNNSSIQELMLSPLFFPKLQYFNAAGNNLRLLKRVHGNGSLTNLVLHSNSVAATPVFQDCEHLQILDMSNNLIGSLEHFNKLLEGLPALRSLNLSGNSASFQFKQLPVNVLLDKTMELIKVEPYLDSCRISFNNTFHTESDQNCIFISNISSTLSPERGFPINSLSGKPENHLLIGLIHGTLIAPQLKKQLPSVFQREKCLLSCFRHLNSVLLSPQVTDKLNIILCHLILNDSKSIKVKIASIGEEVSLKLLSKRSDSGHNISLDTMSPLGPCLMEMKELDTKNESKVNNNENLILNPSISEVDLVEESNIILLEIKTKTGTRGGESSFNCFHDECLNLGDKPSLDTKLKKYSEKIKQLSSDGHIVMAIQPNVESSECDASEFPETFRSWDYILEENGRKEKTSSSSSISSHGSIASHGHEADHQHDEQHFDGTSKVPKPHYESDGTRNDANWRLNNNCNSASALSDFSLQPLLSSHPDYTTLDTSQRITYVQTFKI